MEWKKNLRIGVSVQNRSRRLRYQITHRMVHPTVYLIVCDRSADGRLEIIPSSVLLQKEYPRESLCVMGMAGYKKEALEIVASLVTEAWQAGDGPDAFRFLSGMEHETC